MSKQYCVEKVNYEYCCMQFNCVYKLIDIETWNKVYYEYYRMRLKL